MPFIRQLIASGVLGGGWHDVAAPDASFSWMPFTVEQLGSIFRPKGWDITTGIPSGVTYYVDVATGNDGAAGTSIAPLKAIKTAILKADAVVVYVKPGVYHRTYGLDGMTINKNLTLARWPDQTGEVAITGAQDGLIWTLDDTATYYVTRSLVSRVLDVQGVSDYENASSLTQRADVAGVKANPGSWYLDGSNVLWVRTADSRAPDANIWPMITNVVRLSGDIHFYGENLTLVGGANSVGLLWYANTAGSQTPDIRAKGCKFLWGTSNGIYIQGAASVITENCIAANNWADGFNYQDLNGDPSRAVEINCIGRNNGLTGDNDNGSSNHTNGIMTRIGGSYYGNIGPNVIEIDATKSWNLGSTAYDSASTGVSAAPSNFWTGNLMWLDMITSYFSVPGAGKYDLVNAAGDTIYHRSITTGGNNSIGGALTAY